MKKIVLLVTLLGSMYLFTGCLAAPRATSLEMQQEMVWPESMTSLVPEPVTGTLMQVAKVTSGVLLTYEGIDTASYTTYIEEIAAKGWTLQFSTDETSKSFKNGDSRLDVSLIEGKCYIDYVK